ncbi:MAG: hypothetical protein V1688_03065 [bacterium]
MLAYHLEECKNTKTLGFASKHENKKTRKQKIKLAPPQSPRGPSADGAGMRCFGCFKKTRKQEIK